MLRFFLLVPSQLCYRYLVIKTDKYSLLGYCVQLSENEMHYALKTAGCFIAGPTETLAPGDKELYKRRDVTATVDSIPLCVGLFISIHIFY